ncbi:MAG: glutamine-hydrolyzing GMP synthase, partial [Raineya sp.]|nr:glutamine-hydrolyzing GMP synthase [Raineya sp.]
MDKIIILDFGSQYTQLIARRVRELNVFCEIYPFHRLPNLTTDIKGIILSGSPCSVRDPNAPEIDLQAIRGKVPILGICYGAQLLAQKAGGNVEPSATREYGRANLAEFDAHNPLFHHISSHSQVWMSHGDTITNVPANFNVIARTENILIAAFQVQNEATFGIQFHPEVTHSLEGRQILQNFVLEICQCQPTWTPTSFIQSSIEALQKQLGSDKVVLGLSGGVDSSVAALL